MRIGNDILKELNIENDQLEFRVEVKEGKIILTPKKVYPQTLNDLFADYEGAPITTPTKKFPLHVELPAELSTNGKVLLDQHRMIAIEAGGFSFKESAPETFVKKCTHFIQLLYG